jgi:hypothetical protein
MTARVNGLVWLTYLVCPANVLRDHNCGIAVRWELGGLGLQTREPA